VAITEKPDDISTAFKTSALAATLGSVSWTTLPALPLKGFQQIVEELP
jgi:uncharacterized protein with GYD domain